MSHISRSDYYEFHESKESLTESFPSAYPRRRTICAPKSARPRCAGCGQPFDADELNDQGVCGSCEKEIAAMEEGGI